MPSDTPRTPNAARLTQPRRAYPMARLGVVVLPLGVLVWMLPSCGSDSGSGTSGCPDCRLEEAPPCHRMVCNRETRACEAEKLDDGSRCDSLDFCSYGDTCENGRCMPGREIECPYAVCKTGICDPVTDQCVYEPAHEQEDCSLPCLAGGICVGGECQGEEIDCSWLGDDCNAGQCHPDSGDCYLSPLESGTECVATDPSCASASCDGLGYCVDEPFADDTDCDDGDRCTADDGCASGACVGTDITACTTGDGCCPAGCSDDDDCCTALGPGTDPTAWRYEGIARYDGDAGHVVLTPPRNWNWGQVWLQHELTRTFVARFRFRAAMSEASADGMVFMFYKDPNYAPSAGGDLSFDAGGGCDDATEGTGYGIEIDHWNNTCDSSANHVALIHERVGGHLAVVDDPRTFDGEWHEMVVTVDVDSVAVQLDGDVILSWTGSIDRTFGGLGFGASTGGANDEYVIDDIEISCL